MEAKHEDLLDLVAQVENAVDGTTDGLAADDQLRKQVIDRLGKLKHAVQSPMERAWDIFFQPHHLSSLQTALEAGWLLIVNEAGDDGVTVTDVATKSGADVSLVRTLLRLLAAAGTVKELDVDSFGPTQMSRFFCSPPIAAGLRHAGHDYATTVSSMPEYFANNGYQSPPSPEYSIYTYTHGSSFFKYLSQRPGSAAAFDEFMTAAKYGERTWLDVYPIDGLTVSSDEHILLVDVGGGKGHEVAAFASRKEDSKLPGKLVLQDRPEVIAEVEDHLQKVFSSDAHDFFIPQPVTCHHARAYYLRNVLHDWPDKECTSILYNMYDAMKADYSTLLINEIVLPDTDISFWSAAFDVTMMAVVSGKERTKSEWERLIGSVDGLVIEKIWEFGARGESILEIRKTSSV